MNLRGTITPRTPYAIINEAGEVIQCVNYYTFCEDINQHYVAFQRTIERELELHPGHVIIGPVAELLYMALKGYPMGGSPGDCSLEVALSARRAILSGCQEAHSDALLAQRALVKWGPVVRPWWHTTKLDDEGRVLWDAPEYDLELALPDLPPEWEAETFYTMLWVGELRVWGVGDEPRHLVQE